MRLGFVCRNTSSTSKSRLFVRIATAFALLLSMVLTLPMLAQTSLQEGLPATRRAGRITQDLKSGTMVTLAGSVHPKTRQARDLGSVNPELRLESMALDIGPSATQQKEIEALLAAQQDPKSPQISPMADAGAVRRVVRSDRRGPGKDHELAGSRGIYGKKRCAITQRNYVCRNDNSG